jgi:hypothetical protein
MQCPGGAVNAPGPADRKGIDIDMLGTRTATIIIDDGNPLPGEVTIEQDTISVGSAVSETVPGLKSATVRVFSAGPIGNTGDEVSIRATTAAEELLGVGTIRNLEFDGSSRFTTTIIMRSLEPTETTRG